MAWWGWLLLAWAVLSVPVALFLAKFIAVGKHWEDR